MKALVTCYSRTGNTLQVAKQIADNLDADFEELDDREDWKGALGMLKGSIFALFGKGSHFDTEKNPEDYDLVVIGTPVWAGKPCPAVRDYVNSNQFSDVAFFCTYMRNVGKVFEVLEELSKEPKESLGVEGEGVTSEEKVEEFCSALK